MESADFLHDISDENPSFSDHGEEDVERITEKMTLRTMKNRNPSAILDPDAVRAGKAQKRKIMMTVILACITFSLSLLVLILLIVHWTNTDKEIDKLKQG